MPLKILNNFYSCVIESVLTDCITVWYGSTTMRDHKYLQREVNDSTALSADHFIAESTGVLPPSLHPQHGLFTLLPSGRSYMSHYRAPSVLSFQCDHWLYPWSESRRLVVLTDAVDGSVWKACDQETAVDRATWEL
ncbi:hypothetical protein QTP70_020038 [Hemibagrus guttatus]|uniref:Uncharacterized protein n=1 Tax=Hemibagrus guttatus TaxID=175788 RepID=A0AAE0QJD8_9TELE|nr:hypothetical protein QTP70_020038 [Hemibagrus guttatus]